MYKISNAQLFSGRILYKAYNTAQGELYLVLDKCTYFKFVMNVSVNKRHDCIVNLFLYTDIGIFQLEFQIIHFIKYTTEELAG